MAVRIPVTPDANGVIRLSCGGQELEMVVTDWPRFSADADVPVARTDAIPPSPSKEIWDSINPVDKPGVLMHLDDLAKLGIGSFIDKFGMTQYGENEGSLVFVTGKSVNFHQLCELGERLHHTDLGGDFAIAFWDPGQDDL